MSEAPRDSGEDARQKIRGAVLGAGRAFQVIGGGKVPERTEPADPDACPLVALGHADGVFYVLDIDGQRRSLTARQLGSRHDLLGLFLGSEEWLRRKFPKKIEKQDGEVIVVDFVINRAAAWLQDFCRRAGIFGDHVVLCRPGVWPGEDGTPVVHCGDVVLLGGKLHPAGFRSAAQVWAAAPPAPRPGTPCEAEIARTLQEDLRQLWSFRQAGGEIAVLGLLGNAYYGAAAPWRASGFIAGGTGGGKSMLLTLLRACAPLHHYTNDTTKAGLEQALDGRAMPCLIDEAADRVDQRGARALLDLVLSAAGGEGTRGHRGGIDGRVRRVEMAGAVIMAAIAPPEMEPQHLGRFTIVELRAPEAGADHTAAHQALIVRMRGLGASLWGRALAGFERYLACLVKFRAALGCIGCAPREMDQAGALLAGWHVLTEEGVPSDALAAAGASALEAFVRGAEAVEEEDGPRRVLNHLLSTPIQLDRSTDREPVGSLIAIVLRNDVDAVPSVLVAQRSLAAIGIRVVRAAETIDRQNRPVPRLGEGAGLWIWPSAAPLGTLFANTPHEGRRWFWQVTRLDGAHVRHDVVRIGNQTPRGCWWLPVSHLRLGVD